MTPRKLNSPQRKHTFGGLCFSMGLPLPFPPETMQDDSIVFVLHSPFINNARMSLHPASMNDPEAQVRFINRAMPWYQAYYELRNRAYSNPHIRPRWWAHETDLEAHGYKLDKQSGIASFLNHRKQSLEQPVTFETAPLGLRVGKPAWVWRLQLPHPREAPDEVPPITAPIPRLAKQTLVSFHEELPGSLSYKEAWPADTPVHLLVTHSPGLIRNIGGKTTQFFLPKAYRAEVGGHIDVGSGRIDLLATHHHDDIEILVPVPPGKTFSAGQLLQVGTMHAAGVLPARETLGIQTTGVDGTTFVTLRSPRGATEFVLQ